MILNYQLTSSLKFDYKKIAPVTLPRRRVRNSGLGIVMGFGSDTLLPDDIRLTSFSEILNFLEVTILGQRVCAREFPYLYGTLRSLRTDFFCAHKNSNRGFGICLVWFLLKSLWLCNQKVITIWHLSALFIIVREILVVVWLHLDTIIQSLVLLLVIATSVEVNPTSTQMFSYINSGLRNYWKVECSMEQSS